MQLIINPSTSQMESGLSHEMLNLGQYPGEHPLHLGELYLSSPQVCTHRLSTQLLCPSPAIASCFTPVFLYPWHVSRLTLPQLSSPPQVIFFWILSILLPLLSFQQLLQLTQTSTCMSHKARPVTLFHLGHTTFLAPAMGRNNKWQYLL